MLADFLRTLLLGDIYGDLGCRVVFMKLKSLIKEKKADFVIANGENASGGVGISVDNMNLLFSCGINVITSGNHIWQKREILPYLDSEERLLRPANYGNLLQGHGSVVVNDVGVINLQGRKDMPLTEDPFKWSSELLSKMKNIKNIFVDFHAENAEEKEALGFFLDGKVTAVVGTHIHVQTSDNRILTNKTAYITDLGMTGSLESVIGSDIQSSVERVKTQFPIKISCATTEAFIQGVCVVSDRKTGKALEIERFTY